MMPPLLRVLVTLVLPGVAAAAQPSDVATIESHGGYSTLSVHTFRPLDAVATALDSQFGIAVGAEDPLFQFKGDMMDISVEVPKVLAGTLVPARWGFEVRFAVNLDGSPLDTRDLLRSIVTAANSRSEFAYRLDEDRGAFSFVPTRTHDAQGRSIAATPLLDRPVTIPRGVRKINESAWLMAQELSKQTGLLVSCCQSSVAGVPWGMEEAAFAANGEPARTVLRRLGLSIWHVRCDQAFCFIEMR
jgi:hypothetical protein